MELYHQLSDEELLRRLAINELDAFTAIYQRYWETLLTTAAKALRDTTDAADIVQDVFLSLYNRRAELKLTGSLQPYLESAIRFRAINYIKQNITRRDYLPVFTELSVHHFQDDPEYGLCLKQLQEKIALAVNDLPEKMQQAYRLSRQHTMHHRQIADAMGISEETVKKHIQKALQQIRSAIGPLLTQTAALLFHYFP
jgi:RNA polymerase sigma-70 factor (family 1)